MRCSLSADSRLFYRLILGLPCDDIKMSLNHESRARVGAEPTNAPPPLVNVALACIDRIRSSCRARAYTQTPWHFHYSRSNAASLATRKHSNHFQYQYQPFSAQFVCFHFQLRCYSRVSPENSAAHVHQLPNSTDAAVARHSKIDPN